MQGVPCTARPQFGSKCTTLLTHKALFQCFTVSVFHDFTSMQATGCLRPGAGKNTGLLNSQELNQLLCSSLLQFPEQKAF